MRTADIEITDSFKCGIKNLNDRISMIGLKTDAHFECLIRQLVDSYRRVKYVQVIRERVSNSFYNDPQKPYFDPLKASAWNIKCQKFDEAIWLVFLATHFGKHKRTNWGLVRAIYLGGPNSKVWNWENINNEFEVFRNWLDQNLTEIKGKGYFGNHRKYQSLDAYKINGTGEAFRSFIEWYNSIGNYQGLVAILSDKSNSKEKFAFLYNSIDVVRSFGRMAKFDFITMIGKLGILDVEPDSMYLNGATGPKQGLRLLFFGNKNAKVSDSVLIDLSMELYDTLNCYFGMQIIEDALCNWQKSPNDYVYFNG